MENQHSEMNHNKQTIGSLLLDAGKLKAEDADRIIKAQKQFGLLFGDAAVKLGLITEDDILQVVSKQFNYSCLSMEDEAIDKKVIAAFQSFGPEVEALRSLRSQLSLRWFAENRSLVIAAPKAGAGSSYIAANLAVMFAQVGQKTLLVDANLRAPSQHGLFKCTNKSGLSDVLVKRAGLDAIQTISGIDKLSLLTAGTIPPNPLELLGHSKFAKLSLELEQQFEIIIIDTPAMLDHPDAQIISSIVKGSLLVVQKNKSELADIEAAKKQILVAGAEPVGVVINRLG